MLENWEVVLLDSLQQFKIHTDCKYTYLPITCTTTDLLQCYKQCTHILCYKLQLILFIFSSLQTMSQHFGTRCKALPHVKNQLVWERNNLRKTLLKGQCTSGKSLESWGEFLFSYLRPRLYFRLRGGVYVSIVAVQRHPSETLAQKCWGRIFSTYPIFSRTSYGHGLLYTLQCEHDDVSFSKTTHNERQVMLVAEHVCCLCMEQGAGVYEPFRGWLFWRHLSVRSHVTEDT